ncbi:MAG TPA: hypothetical protein VHG29_12585 [Novosphingobium sp.]|nr:hypothetical protein [Novosphingobium sp.]
MRWFDAPLRMIERLGLDWFEAKIVFEHSLAFGHDALHSFVGVILQLLTAAALRCSVAQWRPWLVVLALELANEASDLYGEIWPTRSAQWGESVKDLLLTMLLPTLLLVISRLAPRLLVRGMEPRP